MKSIVIINPKSGGGKTKNLESALKSALSGVRPGIHRTLYPGHAAGIARKAVKQKADMIIAVGGDGTINEIINVIAGKDIILGIIPSGTANDLATLYNLPSEINKASEIILSRNIREIDLISVNGRYYATAGGVGLPCDVADIANAIRRHGGFTRALCKILGSKLYIFAVITALFVRARHNNSLNIRYGNCSLVVNPLSIMVANQPFLGKNIKMSPGAANDDGVFDICLINNCLSRLKILHLLARILKGTHIFLPSVTTIKADNITIKSEKPISFFGDGEVFHQNTEFNIKLAPKALKLIVPPQKARI
ncbi:MAG: diacylglycerol kinase family lipid kinase [Candidatus Zixiibacteriota bacterium]|nr:MAG: diacylglycerol kinase family lipid kinase [candidate division Zixibacteria bacterium]